MAGFNELQRLGKALMLPIAVLPAAGLLLRLGAEDVFNIPVMSKAGGAVFDNLPAIFAAGIAVGFSRDAAGAAGLAGLVGYYVLTVGMKAINEDINMGVLAGIITGVTAGLLYNRFYNIKLPDYLGFFSGKRFVPIVTGGICFLLAVVFGFIWPPIQTVIEAIGNWIVTSGLAGAFTYGTLNRLLIPVGLHHILNSLVWFVFGSFTKPDGTVVTGDLNRYFAEDPTAGTFMAGFYPVMMFGLPAACIAMAQMARPENRRVTAGVMLSMALTSFLTGITEPIEFTFMFLAPILYAVHAVLTGVSLALLDALGVKHGFTFSAGALDYILNFGLSTKGILIIPIGLAYFALYYFLFRFMIQTLDLKTPGREADTVIEGAQPANLGDIPATADSATLSTAELANDPSTLARQYLTALGGAANIRTVDACITRLRLTLADRNIVSEAQLKAAGAKGVIRPGTNGMQVILGPMAEIIAEEMKKLLNAPSPGSGTTALGSQTSGSQSPVTTTVDALPKISATTASGTANAEKPVLEKPASEQDVTALTRRYLAALGGKDNIKTVDANDTRLRLTLVDRDSILDEPLRTLGAQNIIRPGYETMQIILGAMAEPIAAELKKLLND